MVPSEERKRRNIALYTGVLVILFSILACSLPGSEATQAVETESQPDIQPGGEVTQPPADQPTEPPPPPDVDFEGVSFSFDDSIANQVIPETIAAVTDQEVMPGMVAPQHLQFNFDGYVLADTFHEARIMVFPVSEFQSVNSFVGEVIDDLEWLLSEKPNVPVDALPFIPMWNAGSLIEAHLAYLDFQNGSGVRYLTQHGQSYWPINNQDLFYTFQGLTSDGSYYVAAILPISNPILLETGDDYPMDDFAAFADNFPNYVDDIAQQLNAQADPSFIPDLSLLDALFESLLVE
ncbi:MAG: hypothetical protein FVQ83_14935 [Chloroflexi bacterium]|nr:hypothetical protein [Chloroflexota bacterium]